MRRTQWRATSSIYGYALSRLVFSPIHDRFESIAGLDVPEISSFLALSKQPLCILLQILKHAHIDHVPSASVSVAIAVQSTPLSLNPPSLHTLVQHTSSELDLRYILHPSSNLFITMGKLIKNHWARLIVLTAAVCTSPLPFPLLHSRSNHKTHKKSQTKSQPPSKASFGRRSSGTS